jgi:hypothetical protein
MVNAMLGILNGQAQLNIINGNLQSCRLKHVKTL